MSLGNPIAAPDKARPVPPRERIVTAARDLFYRLGFRGVGVDAIAEAAATNKMTLYRHFASKDELLAECLRQAVGEVDANWDRLAAAHADDPLGQLHAWLERVAERVVAHNDRGCPLANAAVEIPEKEHPARRVIEEFKRAQRDRLAALCRKAGLTRPDELADELFLLLEGARMSMHCVGPEGPGAKFVRLGEGLIAAHRAPEKTV